MAIVRSAFFKRKMGDIHKLDEVWLFLKTLRSICRNIIDVSTDLESQPIRMYFILAPEF